MTTSVVDALLTLIPTGRQGFEGLVAQLLSRLTDRQFHLARSGYQSGHDMIGVELKGSVIAVECKRYGKSTELDKRELLGELTQADLDVPDLDLWLLVTSQQVDSRLLIQLKEAGHARGIEVAVISSDDSDPSSLEVLCASAPDLILASLTEQLGGADKGRLIEDLERVAACPGYAGVIDRLRRQFASETVGYEHWRYLNNRRFLDNCGSDTLSRAAFGQLLNVADKQTRLIDRQHAWRKLSAWLELWHGPHSPLVLLGEEGDGKTWAVAAWLANRIEAAAACPPIMFVSSQDAADNSPTELLLKGLLGSTDWSNEEFWRERLSRWMRRKTAGEPLLLLVLDGINERRSSAWWRTLLDRLSAEPWAGAIALIVTCRTGYWQQYFAPLRHLMVDIYELPPYEDRELSQALSQHHLDVADIPKSILPLVCKPRYFDLVVKHRERMAESGDITIARLVYEDWRDRYQRKTGLSLDDTSFQNLVRSVAGKYREGEHNLQWDEIRALLPGVANPEDVYNELVTGGILRSVGGLYTVDQRLLSHGFGLLLADEVQQAYRAGASDVSDLIARWLEPHAGMDIKGAICGAAALQALNSAGFPKLARVALLRAWLTSQNPGSDVEQSFPAYLPLDPACYIELAEEVWSDAHENQWGQEFIMRSLLRWRNVDRVAVHFWPTFERWLGFVPMRGYPHQRGQNDERVDEAKEQIAQRVGSEIRPGPFSYGSYKLTFVEDDGLLRLSRTALAVISHLPRERFMRAFATGCLAEAIAGYPIKYDLSAWVIRSSPVSVWAEVEAEALRLARIGTIPAQQAAYRLLTYEGSRAAIRLRSQLPEDLFPPHPLRERFERDPCTSGFTWRREDCRACVERSDVSPDWVARQIAPYCADPDLKVPPYLPPQFAALAESLPVEPMWISLVNTTEEYTLESIAPTLWAYAPEAMANVIRRGAADAEQREQMPLRQLAIELVKHTLILTVQEREPLLRAWQRLVARGDAWNQTEREAEFFLFPVVIADLEPDEQLSLLLARPENAADLLSFESLFVPVADWDSVLSSLQGSTNVRTVQRILWFVTSPRDHIPSVFARVLALLVQHEDSLVRACALRALLLSEDGEAQASVVSGNWAWSASSLPIETHWGSLLLCQHGRSLPYSELRCRIHPAYLGFAVKERGLNPSEVHAYADDIFGIWRMLANHGRDLPVDLPDIKVASPCANDVRIFTRAGLGDSAFSRSIEFVNRDAYWGGLLSSKEPHWPSDEEFEQQARVQNEIAWAAIKEQQEGGNLLFCRHFPTDSLRQVMERWPDLAQEMVDAVRKDAPHAARLLRLGQSFYEALCGILLIQQPTTGIMLYRQLDQLPGVVNFVEEGTQLRWLQYALFRAPVTPDLVAEWDAHLNACTTDQQLLELVLLANSEAAQEWLESRIAYNLESGVLYKQALALSLLGFTDTKEGEASLVQWATDDPATWIAQVASRCLEKWQKNKWAQHWLEKYVTAERDLDAWAAFRLFLQCVDRRFYHWQARISIALSGSQKNDRRMRFLASQKGEIRHSANKNEKPMSNTFLTEKILANEAWPWMADRA